MKRHISKLTIAPALMLLASCFVSFSQPAATHQSRATYAPGTTLAMTNTFSYGGQLLSLLWRPHLPAGWTIAAVAGTGTPELQSGEIIWTGAMPPSPIQMVYTVQVPANASGSQDLRGEVEYQLSGMVNPTTLYANPDPLAVSNEVGTAIAAQHVSAANYTAGSLLGVTNTLSYNGELWSLLWRPHLPAGWVVESVSGTGAPELQSGEIVWTGVMPPSPIQMVYTVQVPAEASGPYNVRGEVEYQFSDTVNPATLYANPDPLTVSNAVATELSAHHASSATYTPGSPLALTNTLNYTGELWSLLWRPHLPTGWLALSVSGTGTPELQGAEIVWTGAMPPSPIQMVYTVQVPADASGTQSVRGEVEYQFSDMVNPATLYASPDPLTVSNSPIVPVADFSANPTSGVAPLTVVFTNLSTGAIEYTWDFGDGNLSTNVHPANTYTNPGAYSVTLTAIGAGGTNTLFRTNFIVVTEPWSGTDYALQFNGYNRITIPNSPSLNPSDITVETWVNFGRLAYGDGWSPTDSQFIVSKGGDTTYGSYWLAQGGSSPTDLGLAFVIGPSHSNPPWVHASVPLHTNRWYHIAATYGQGAMMLYLDGALVASNYVGTAVIGNASPLYFGFEDAWPFYLTGEIGEVRIWDQARSEAEIRAGMCHELLASEPGLIGAWNFDEPLDSQSVLDRSTNANHGVLGITAAQESADPVRAPSTILCPSPVIVLQPVSRQVSLGAEAVFETEASGAPPLSWQWRFNGTDIADATGSAFSRTNAQCADAGQYEVVVTNFLGSTTSSVATLTVVAPPVIVSGPSSQSLAVGQDATFLVAATNDCGNGLFYQWRWNGADIAGETGSSYSRTNVQCADAGSFDVVVTNQAGSLTSSVAVLTVVAPPVILSGPAGQAVPRGQNASFVVQATNNCGDGLVYQWRWNGADIAGETGSSYIRPSVQCADAGSLDVVVTNLAGSLTSSVAALTVVAPPVILSGPASETLLAGQDTTFVVIATNDCGGGLLYQWRLNGGILGGATSSALVLTGVTAGHAGEYSVEVHNLAGSVTSSSAVLTVQAEMATNFIAPGLISIPALGAATPYPSSNLVSGVAGTVIKTTVTLSNLSHTYPDDVDILLVGPSGQNVMLMSDCGGKNSNAITAVTLTFDDSAASALPDVNKILSGTYRPTDYGTNDVMPSPAPTRPYGTALSVFNGSNPNGTWRLFVRDEFANDSGGITNGWTLKFTVALTNGPVIWTQPESSSVATGQPVELSVAAGGSPPLHWQWRKNGLPISDATNAMLTLASAQCDDAATYDVVVANPDSSVTSSPAVLTVVSSPTISFQPADQVANVGQTVVFAVGATNDCGGAPAYQWRKEGVDLADETGTTLTRSNVQPSDAGHYAVVITNLAGSVTSAVARLSVVPPDSLVVTPSTIDFGLIPTGALAQASFVVSNAGLTTLAVSAAVDPPFALLSETPFTIGQSGSTELVIRFAPTLPGVFSSAVVCTSSGGSSTNLVTGRAVGAVYVQWQQTPEDGLVLSFDTVLGLKYVVQYKEDVNNPVWQVLQTVPGDGATKIITESTSTALQRFYRLSVE
jgi:PKD repeat protein/subtilisin-like proprotein convertase family protein